MALTRKMLKAMGIEDEKIDQIIEAHTETVDALKEERDRYKGDADKLEDVQKKLDEANKTIESGNKDSYKVKYEAIKEEFDSYKADITAKESKSAKESAYKALLKEAGVSEKRLEAVLKVSDVNSIELDKDGKVKDADQLKASIKTEWADFIVTEGKQGAGTATPPSGGTGGAMTKEQIVAIKDPVERRAAISQNMNLFTGGN